MEQNNCKNCNKIFKSYKVMKQKFCSQKCYHSYNKGRPLVGERLVKQRKLVKKAIDSRKNNPEIRQRWIQKMKEVTTGNKNHRWIKDRNKLVNQDERNSYKYIQWCKKVKARDKNKCRIGNIDCKGELEVHHILSWKDYPELHYHTNNGITLCHAHHPRKRAEEKRLIPFLKKLVTVSKV